MNYWLMSEKLGLDGKCIFDFCKKRGIILTSWVNGVGEKPGDLRNYQDMNHLYSSWGKCKDLTDFVYTMRIGDIVYIRGDINKTKYATIVGKARITSDYYFDDKFLQNDDEWEDEECWEHVRKVEWLDFTPVFNRKIHNQITIYKMKDIDIEYMKTIDPFFYEDAETKKSNNEIDRINKLKDGAVKEGSYTYFERNPKNRESAVELQGLTCKVCGFNFKDTYGDIGDGFIEVHHIEQLSKTGETLVDPGKDLVVLCSNCHRMLHRSKDNNLKWQDLKEKIKKGRQ